MASPDVVQGKREIPAFAGMTEEFRDDGYGALSVS